MYRLVPLLNALRRDERGISALEYAVLAAIVLVAVVAGIRLLDPTGLFAEAAKAISDAPGGAPGG